MRDGMVGLLESCNDSHSYGHSAHRDGIYSKFLDFGGIGMPGLARDLDSKAIPSELAYKHR